MRDLARIDAHTEREWGAKQRRQYLAEIKGKLKLLRDMPGMGVRRDDISNGLRAHPVRHHLVFYRDKPERVEIVRILHQSMDPTRHLTRARDSPNE